MRYGFLGLGIMGSRMAKRLLDAGFDLIVWNRDTTKCSELVKLGAKQKRIPKEVVAEADITFAMVSDPQASLEICFGDDGVLEGIAPGHGYIEMSTIDPETVQKIEMAIESRGARFLEAPVSGTKKPAADGTLVILAAGNKNLFDEALEAFNIMGKTSLYLGEVGQGAKMKLVVNLVLGTMMEILGEALALGIKGGLAGEQILKVLSDGAMANTMFSVKGPMILNNDVTTSFPLKHLSKDLNLAINLGNELGQDLPVTKSVHEIFQKAWDKGFGNEDISAIKKVI